MKQEIMFKKVWDEEEMKLNEKVMPYIRDDRIPWYLIKEELREDEDIRVTFSKYAYNCMVIYFTQDTEEIPTTVRQVARKEMRDEALTFVRHLNLIFGLDWKYVADVLIESKEDSITENKYYPTHEQVEKIADSMQAWLEAFRADMIEAYKQEYGSDWEKHWLADKKESYEVIKQRQALFKPIIIPEQEE